MDRNWTSGLRGRRRSLLAAGAAVALAAMATVGAVGYAAAPAAQAQPSPAEQERGIILCRVLPDGPAAQAGARRSDILLTFAGEEVDDLAELRQALANRQPGESVLVTVLHGSEVRTLTVALGNRGGAAYLGVEPCGPLLGGLPPGLREGLPFPRGERLPFGFGFGPESGFEVPGGVGISGALVTQVSEGSPAAAVGLRAGEVITAVDGQPLDGPNALAEAIGGRSPGAIVTLTVQGRGPDAEPRQVTVQLGQHPERPGAGFLGVRTAWVEARRSPEGARPDRPFRFPRGPLEERQGPGIATF